MSRDRKSRRFVKERELFLKSIMLGLKPAQASSKDPSRDPFHMKPFLSLSNTWFPNQISPLSITTLFFPWRCAKWLKFEPGIYDVTIWSRHDCAKQLIFIGPSSATHYKWPGQTSNSPYLWRQLCQSPDMSEISVGSPIRRSNPTKILSQQNSVWFYVHRSHNTTKQKFKQNHSPVNVEIRGNFYSRRLIDLPNQKNNTCYFGQCGLIMQKMLGMLGTFCRNCAWMMPCHLTFNFIVLKIFASNKMKKLKNTYRRA